MSFDKPVTRRESIKKLLKLWASLGAAGGALSLTLQTPLLAASASENKKFIIEGVGHTEGYSIKTLTRMVFESAGGAGRFVSRGDVVVIKPNLSWARRPEMAATTNPEVLEAVIELCQEAGAKKVRIADHTIHDATRCFALSGAAAIAKKTGADLVHPRASLMKKMSLKGNRLGIWPVFVPLVEADALINLPVAKHHSLSTLTIGMKNWIGGVGGSRYSLHQDINQSIVDLANFFKPTVTLIDAIRIMTKNGPSGGSTAYVTEKNTLILSDDPVAGDASAALLFNSQPQNLGFIRMAREQGLGTFDFQTLARQKVVL
jgi:uncharacterized protein (DUF362 family)